MKFADKLTQLMSETGISQARLHELTGIGKPSISNWVNGKNEPSEERKRKIAVALGVQEDYFRQFLPSAQIQQNDVFNVPVAVVAKLMKKSTKWVMKGLQDGIFPWGYAVKLKEWSYYISSVKFTEYTGIKIPTKEST